MSDSEKNVYDFDIPHLSDQNINDNIKADELQVVDKIMDKYDYFK